MQLSGPAAVAVTCCTSGDLRTLYMWVQTVDGPKLESYELGFLATDQTEVFVYGIAHKRIPQSDLWLSLIHI